MTTHAALAPVVAHRCVSPAVASIVVDTALRASGLRETAIHDNEMGARYAPDMSQQVRFIARSLIVIGDNIEVDSAQIHVWKFEWASLTRDACRSRTAGAAVSLARDERPPRGAGIPAYVAASPSSHFSPIVHWSGLMFRMSAGFVGSRARRSRLRPRPLRRGSAIFGGTLILFYFGLLLLLLVYVAGMVVTVARQEVGTEIAHGHLVFLAPICVAVVVTVLP